MSTGYGFLKLSFLYIFISIVLLLSIPSYILQSVRFGVADGSSDVLFNFHANKSHFADVFKVML